MSPFSAIQYVQNIYDLFILNDMQTTNSLNGTDEASRRTYPMEEIIRYNNLNPLHNWIFKSRLNLSSDVPGRRCD
jgi:hypothetical protein